MTEGTKGKQFRTPERQAGKILRLPRFLHCIPQSIGPVHTTLIDTAQRRCWLSGGGAYKTSIDQRFLPPMLTNFAQHVCQRHRI